MEVSSGRLAVLSQPDSGREIPVDTVVNTALRIRQSHTLSGNEFQIQKNQEATATILALGNKALPELNHELFQKDPTELARFVSALAEPTVEDISLLGKLLEHPQIRSGEFREARELTEKTLLRLSHTMRVTMNATEGGFLPLRQLLAEEIVGFLGDPFVRQLKSLSLEHVASGRQLQAQPAEHLTDSERRILNAALGLTRTKTARSYFHRVSPELRFHRSQRIISEQELQRYQFTNQESKTVISEDKNGETSLKEHIFFQYYIAEERQKFYETVQQSLDNAESVDVVNDHETLGDVFIQMNILKAFREGVRQRTGKEISFRYIVSSKYYDAAKLLSEEGIEVLQRGDARISSELSKNTVTLNMREYGFPYGWATISKEVSPDGNTHTVIDDIYGPALGEFPYELYGMRRYAHFAETWMGLEQGSIAIETTRAKITLPNDKADRVAQLERTYGLDTSKKPRIMIGLEASTNAKEYAPAYWMDVISELLETNPDAEFHLVITTEENIPYVQSLIDKNNLTKQCKLIKGSLPSLLSLAETEDLFLGLDSGLSHAVAAIPHGPEVGEVYSPDLPFQPDIWTTSDKQFSITYNSTVDRYYEKFGNMGINAIRPWHIAEIAQSHLKGNKPDQRQVQAAA